MKRIVIRIFSILLIAGGIVFLVIGIFPIFEMKQQVKQSLKEWEMQKEQFTSQQVSKEEQIRDATIISTLKIAEFEQVLPIRIGTTNQILNQGVGLDTQTPLIGEKGNSVLYGHREEIFWNLK
ncbi:MAG: sortase domain-containing protein, partial [Turicibacter sp.]